MYSHTHSRRRLVAIGTVAAGLLLYLGGSSNAGIQGSGIVQRVLSIGRITGFGSIFVNGIEYDSSNAQIRVDEQPASEFQLQIGQIVTVEGDINGGVTGTAAEVSFAGNVVGPIAAIDLENSSILILGQTVRVTDETIFGQSIQPASLEGLQVGMLLEVSAFADAGGELIASRADLKPTGTSLQVKGTVLGLDTAAQTFRINALSVNYSGVIPEGPLANGSVALVQGAIAAGQSLNATRIEASTGSGGVANEDGHLEGLITTFTSAENFKVGDQLVVTDAKTHFVLHDQMLGPNLSVEVKGTFNATGALVADKVQAKQLKQEALGNTRGHSRAHSRQYRIGVKRYR